MSLSRWTRAATRPAWSSEQGRLHLPGERRHRWSLEERPQGDLDTEASRSRVVSRVATLASRPPDRRSRREPQRSGGRRGPPHRGDRSLRRSARTDVGLATRPRMMRAQSRHRSNVDTGRRPLDPPIEPLLEVARRDHHLRQWDRAQYSPQGLDASVGSRESEAARREPDAGSSSKRQPSKLSAGPGLAVARCPRDQGVRGGSCPPSRPRGPARPGVSTGTR